MVEPWYDHGNTVVKLQLFWSKHFYRCRKNRGTTDDGTVVWP